MCCLGYSTNRIKHIKRTCYGGGTIENLASDATFAWAGHDLRHFFHASVGIAVLLNHRFEMGQAFFFSNLDVLHQKGEIEDMTHRPLLPEIFFFKTTRDLAPIQLFLLMKTPVFANRIPPIPYKTFFSFDWFHHWPQLPFAC